MTCGLRYGGSSRRKEEVVPFSIVEDKSFVAPKEEATANINRMDSIRALRKELSAAKKTLSKAISIGNRPLQGIKLFVSIASIFSRGESMILHPTTPTALHPMPIVMVKACFPQA